MCRIMDIYERCTKVANPWTKGYEQTLTHTRRYGTLRWPTFSSCGGLRPLAEAIFTNSGPLGRVGLGVAMSVVVCVCVSAPSSAVFFLGLSLVLRSHDQIPASRWWSKVDPKSGGQKWTPKVAVKKGPQKWRSKVDPKSGGQKWTPKEAVKKGPQKWRPKGDPKSGSQNRTPKVAAKSGPQ